MKKEVTRKINKIYGLESGSVIKLTPENFPLEKTEINPKEFYIEFAGQNGIRITNDGTHIHGTMVEFKNRDGKWEPLGAVQNISIEIGVDLPIPKIKIERYILTKEHNDS